MFILKKRRPRVHIPVYKYPTGMDERGPLLYSGRHRERQQVLAGKWEIHNSVGSREKLYHEGGHTLGQESRKHMGSQSLKILRTLLPRALKNLLLWVLP